MEPDRSAPEPSLRATFGFVIIMLAAFVLGWFAILALLEARR